MQNTINKLKAGSYNKLRKLMNKNKMPAYSEQKSRGYRFVLSNNALEAVGKYQEAIALGNLKAGMHLKHVIAKQLNKSNITDNDVQNYVLSIGVYEFLELIIKTKQPKIFAENSVIGDGRDWNQAELAILNDIGAYVPVTIYDNGKWKVDPGNIHRQPFHGNLLFVNGVRLSTAENAISPDKQIVVKQDVSGKAVIDKFLYRKLLEERLVPLLLEANRVAAENGKKAFITVPGIGCGAFAGNEFASIIKPIFQDTLLQIIADHQHELNHIQGIMYDSYDASQKTNLKVGNIEILIRSSKYDAEVAMLNPPSAYGKKYKDCELFSFVAGDPNSYMGCDFISGLNHEDKGVRYTNEGSAAAATDLMTVTTNVKGTYIPEENRFDVAEDTNKSWHSVIKENNVELLVRDARSYSVRPVQYTQAVLDAKHDLDLYLHNSTVTKRADKLAWDRKAYVEQRLQEINQKLTTLSYDAKIAFLNQEIETITPNLSKHHRSIGGILKKLTHSDTTVTKLLLDYLEKLRDSQRYDDPAMVAVKQNTSTVRRQP